MAVGTKKGTTNLSPLTTTAKSSVNLLSTRLYCRHPELHRVPPRKRVAGYTAGRESHPALKTNHINVYICNYS